MIESGIDFLFVINININININNNRNNNRNIFQTLGKIYKVFLIKSQFIQAFNQF